MSLNFVSEEVLEEKRKQRQEEWEKVRTAEDPMEVPEEETDDRSLYHRLQEQKMKKEADKAEEHKLRNMVQGLKKDETEFLDFVATRQMEHDREKQMEEEKLLQEMEERRGKLDDLDEAAATSSSGAALKSAPKSRIVGASKRTNQSALLAGVVKKKARTSTTSTSEEPGEKNGLTTTTTTTTGNPGAAVVGPTTADNDDDNDADDGDDDDDSKDKEGTGFARVIGVLPGIGEYTDSSDSDSENEEETISTKHLGFMKQKKKQAKKSNGE